MSLSALGASISTTTVAKSCVVHVLTVRGSTHSKHLRGHSLSKHLRAHCTVIQVQVMGYQNGGNFGRLLPVPGLCT